MQTYDKTCFTGHFNSMNGLRESERGRERERERTPGAHLSSVICLWQVESGWILGWASQTRIFECVCVCVTGSGGNLGREPGNVSVFGANEIGLLSLLGNPAKARSRWFYMVCSWSLDGLS